MADDPAIASVLRIALNDPGNVVERTRLGEDWDGSGMYEPMAVWQARAIQAALTEAGFSIVRTEDLERLEETASAARGRFPRCEVIKPDRDRDFYVGWSHNVDAPVWAGTRAETLAEDCPESRLRRADETGSSYMPSAPGCRWDSSGLVAEQRGYLPRRNLAAYVTAYMENRMQDAFDLLEPFEDETEVRRD